MPDSDFARQGMQHSEFREWASAALGETRQVYARDAEAPPDARLVYMPDGAADAFRDRAKAGGLICPVPGCPSPELTTRACSDRRDHFMHVHAPADPEHNAAYAQLAVERLLTDWANDQDEVVDVRGVEFDGASVAILARLTDGSKVVLCYVDTKLGADAWDERNKALRSGGYGTAWIFALRKMYFAPPEPAEPVVEDSERTDLILDQPIYRRMRKNGSWPLLINPELQKVANVLKPGGKPARSLRFRPSVSDRVQYIADYRLSECRICRFGVATPAISAYTLWRSSENWQR